MSDQQTDNSFTKRGFIFSAITVGVLAVAALLMVLLPLGQGDSEEGAAPAPLATSTRPAADADPSVCGLPGFEKTGEFGQAPEAEWTFVGTMAAPSDPDIGPGVTDPDGLRRCYAHTAAGAVFASTNLWATGSDARLATLATDRLLAPGPGRDAAMSRPATSDTNGLAVQVVGVKLLSYSADEATVDTAFRLNNGQLASIAQSLRWVDGDWKAVVTDDGKSPYQAAQLQSLGGYVLWSGTE